VVRSNATLERIKPPVVLKYPEVLVAQIGDVVFGNSPNLEAIVG
jgi:hypothetical protein